ncbi:MAG TPA: heme o synthase [Candidatus Paceibacterota bacterium]|nr:heme o synthase [Candidatus Paceibacterota bacterium]
MFATYFSLTKPRMVLGNSIVAAAGFLFASRGSFDLPLFVAMVVGLAAVMAAACVFNNYIDRDIDAKMPRTLGRAFVRGQVTPRNALVLGTVLIVFGLLVLFFFTNVVAASVAAFGFFAYVVLYSLWGKRASWWGTLVGALSGATPPVVGYCAVAGRIDAAAIILFLILICWQMPHFYAIAIYRLKEYAAAGVPVLPVQKGIEETKRHMLWWIAGFGIAISLLTFLAGAGLVYLVVMESVALAWLVLAINGFRTQPPERAARQLFFFSLIVLIFFALMLALSGSLLLP